MSETYLAPVRTAVADALALDEDEVTADATLLDELGAESIDLLDILFRLERATGVKVQAADLAAHVQGGIPDEEFGDEAADVVTPRGMAHLVTVMPQLQGLDAPLRPAEVMGRFTVANLAGLVAARAAQPVA